MVLISSHLKRGSPLLMFDTEHFTDFHNLNLVKVGNCCQVSGFQAYADFDSAQLPQKRLQIQKWSKMIISLRLSKSVTHFVVLMNNSEEGYQLATVGTFKQLEECDLRVTFTFDSDDFFRFTKLEYLRVLSSSEESGIFRAFAPKSAMLSFLSDSLK